MRFDPSIVTVKESSIAGQIVSSPVRLRVLSCNRNTRWHARDSVSLTPRYNYEITCAITGKLRGIQAVKAICVS